MARNSIKAAASYITLESFHLKSVETIQTISTDCFKTRNSMVFFPKHSHKQTDKLILIVHRILSPWGQPERLGVVESRAEKHKEASLSSAGSHQGGAWQCLDRFWSWLQSPPDQSETRGCPEKRVLPGARGKST